jgi:hypothetical protein
LVLINFNGLLNSCEAIVLIEQSLAHDLLTVGGNFDIRFDGKTRAAQFLTWLYAKL